MNGCEPNEVILRMLPPGACFAMLLARGERRGVVLAQLSGSTLVDVGAHEHWCYEAPVVPHPEALAGEWLAKEERAMTTKKNGTKKSDMERKVTIFEVSAKESKALADKENDSQLAIVYRGVMDNGPCEFDAVYQAIYRRFQGSKAKPEKIRINIGTYLHRLVKAGLVKRFKRSVQAATVAA